MAPVKIPGLSIPLLTGPLILGYMWSYCLYGMLIVQVYMYSEVFPKDKVEVKALVWSTFMLETVFSILMTIAAWNEFATGWGDPDTLSKIDWAWVPLFALNAVLAAIAQGFYMWRIWGLTKRLWLPVLTGCVMLMQVVLAFYVAIAIGIEGRGVAHLVSLSPEITLWLIGSATCDVLITVSLVFVLSRHKRKAPFGRTSSLLNRLIRFSVETGSATSLWAIMEAILWLSCRQWNLHYMFFFILGRVYSNMLMATLNCRAPVFQDPATESDEALTLTSISRAGVRESHVNTVTNDLDPVVADDVSSNVDIRMHGEDIGDKSNRNLVD